MIYKRILLAVLLLGAILPTGRAQNYESLKAEAEKRNYELDPVSGEEMQRLAKEVMSQPPAVLERMKKVLGE